MAAQDKRKVAYFSMEVGLTSKIPTYSGGLGILAGDMLKAAADESFPMVGITLLSKHGYFFQRVENGMQTETPVSWSVDDFLKPVSEKVQVYIGEETVTVGAWMLEINGIDGYKIPLYYLHTDFPENSKKSREITDVLYGTGHGYRLKQEIVLGVGGIRLLRKMGYSDLEKYHMNEGHSALLALELQKELNNIDEVKKRCVFTTHTPVPSGHDKFVMNMVDDLLEEDLRELLPKEYTEQGELNMTELALDLSGYINGVAKRHTEVSKTMFPNYPIHSITNGIHTPTWVSAHFAKLYDKYMPNWRRDPEALRDIFAVSKHEIWKAHFECKKQIIDYANAFSNAGLDYDYFTLGWARRFTSYKRPDMLLENIHRLIEMADKTGPIQIIYSGKSHPYDTNGKELIQKTIYLSNQMRGKVKMVYLHNYDIYLAKYIVSGVDAWINTPLPPQEASGTSGMKCAANGIPHISVLDGWWQEGYVNGKTGWAFDTAEELYDLLETKIIPCFYNNREAWEEIMQRTIMINGSFFTSKRMLDEYRKSAYMI